MAGAMVLAARAALRSGAGMVRCCVAPASMAPIQAAVPEATVAPWPRTREARGELLAWADALLVGPGLGAAEARALVQQWLSDWTGPVVVDADALSAFAGEASALGVLLAGREAVITPHAGEAGRLLGRDASAVVAEPYAAAASLARGVSAVTLLKGVPTVVHSPGGASFVSARGTPALATAGSGDVLAGIVTTLLAQTNDAVSAAGIGAWIHGRAAEVATAGRPVRGVTLTEVLHALSSMWRVDEDLLHDGELAWLPRTGDD
jgi:NAD(P)H-hydrate epimerase